MKLVTVHKDDGEMKVSKIMMIKKYFSQGWVKSTAKPTDAYYYWTLVN